MKRSTASAYPSRALAKGLALIGELSRASEPQSLADLARAIDLGKPSTLRLLRTLEELRYISRDNTNACWIAANGDAPSGGFQEHLPKAKILESATKAMKSLAVDTGETVTLAMLFHDHIRVIKVLESPRHIRMSNYEGRILQPYASSLGKAIAAFQPDDVRRELVNVYGLYPFTPQTITDPAAIEAEFEKVRRTGFAYDLEETVEGGCCVAAPIPAADQAVTSAISVSQPKGRYSEERRQKLEILLTAATKQVVEQQQS